ncbi:MAG: hypothetical protein ABIW46_00315, partial [Acidimicrobiales bacterium]
MTIVLRSLLDGTESTLLLLELVNNPHVRTPLTGRPPMLEPELVRTLTGLQERALVAGRVETGTGTPEPGTGVPEYEQGRS